jgi:hypothetical protein
MKNFLLQLAQSVSEIMCRTFVCLRNVIFLRKRNHLVDFRGNCEVFDDFAKQKSLTNFLQKTKFSEISHFVKTETAIFVKT